MPKVKIVLVQTIYGSDDYSETILRGGITDWEEVTDEELKLLKNPVYLFRMFEQEVSYPYQPVVIVQDTKTIRDRFAIAEEFIRKEEQRRAEQAAEAQRKREERAKQKAHMREVNERKQFEKLKEKFEGDTQ